MFSCKQFHVLYFLSVFFNMGLSTKYAPPTLVVTLIHHHAASSPYYNSTKTAKDLAEFDLRSSIYRALDLVDNGDSSLHLTDLRSELTPRARSGFLVHLQVGSKNINQYVIMDTASSFLWINCEPCGYNVPLEIFDPKESSTYQTEDCVGVDACLAPGFVKLKCNDDPDEEEDVCSFEIRFLDGTFSEGELGRENFRFAGTKEVQLHDILFGCSHNSNLYANGMFGLGTNSFSILKQKDYSKFSYCIGNISDRSYAHHKLIISDKFSITPGNETPLIVENRYYINLVGITIGDIRLDFDPKTFRRNSTAYTGGMVVDSGSTYTFIPMVVYNKFEAVMIEVVNGERNYSFPYNKKPRLCYNGELMRDLGSFPSVKLEFEGDVLMELIAENVFQQVSQENFCLGVLPIEYVYEGATFSILGNLMQQYLYVAFDLDQNKLGFQDIDCSLL